ncbi:PREDICTED: uncharacterized protein LOC104569081 [Tinamus guttatus]|uniref:uncharacterized protein LOC104569081 n=1 Tax=Tinamus guttatus TaxID=94827 RepID=UPI00052F393D|nr:PREDICTED: uncharacterized protein LOC104569081 [Tinamus guttatus]
MGAVGPQGSGHSPLGGTQGRSRLLPAALGAWDRLGPPAAPSSQQDSADAAPPATPAALCTAATARTLTSSTPADGTELPNTARVATQGTSSAGPTTTIVVPTVVLVLLAAAGSAVIWILVRRRREAQQRPAGEAMCLGQLKVAADPQAPGNAQPLHSTARAAAAADGDVYSNSLAEGPWDPSPPPPHRAGATSTGTEREPVPQDEQLYENTLYENTRRQKRLRGTGCFVYDRGEKISWEGGSWTMRIFLVLALFSGAGAAMVTGPARVHGKPGASVSVSCRYKVGYELYPKCWCRWVIFCFCITPIICTNDTESWVTKGRVSIKDNRRSHTFTVTLWDLVPADTGRYCCKVAQLRWFNLWHATRLVVSAGSTGVKEVDKEQPEHPFRT